MTGRVSEMTTMLRELRINPRDADTPLTCGSRLAADKVRDPLSGVPVRQQAGACNRPLPLARRRGAFSLIEVIIAVGVFSVAVVVILAMLPTMSRSTADSADGLVAQSLADSARVELTRLVDGGGFDALANRLPEMAAPLVDGLSLVAPRDGRRLYSPDYLPPPAVGQLPQAEHYFLVEVWRFNQPPLRFDPAAAVLAVYVRVSWPYMNPGAASATPLSARSQFTFSVSLNR